MANKLLVDFAYKSNACMRKILKRVHCGGFDYNTENIDSKRQYNLNVGLINIDLKRSSFLKTQSIALKCLGLMNGLQLIQNKRKQKEGRHDSAPLFFL